MDTLFKEKKTELDSIIKIAAIRLAMIFTDEKDIPSNYKNVNTKKKKKDGESNIQKKFKAQIKCWEKTITTIISKNSSSIAWRFINLKPELKGKVNNVSENEDFIKFNNYLILRRDVEKCDDEELGCLAQLLTNFQKVVEKSIGIDKPDFVVIDFEHATRYKGSVCSVGIVSYKNEQIIDEYYTLIKPPDNKYEWFTTSKHQLNSITTEGAPEFIDIYPEIEKRLKNNKVIAHGAFHTDKHCLEQALEINKIRNELNIDWDCTQNLTNCKLDILAKVCNLELNHHNALSDAKVCGAIYLLYKKGELPLNKILEEKAKQKLLKKSVNEFFPESLHGDVLKPDFENVKDKSNPFYMKKVVISGLEIGTKKKIANELKLFGADIDTSVGIKTNYLIIGPSAGPSKLSKMKKNIQDGKEATILSYEEYEVVINKYR